MKNKLKNVMGWEMFEGVNYLRIELVKPRLCNVWPGEAALAKPQARLRRLTDMVMSRDDIYAILTDPILAVESGLTGDDLRLLSRALAVYPRGRGKRTKTGNAEIVARAA